MTDHERLIAAPCWAFWSSICGALAVSIQVPIEFGISVFGCHVDNYVTFVGTITVVAVAFWALLTVLRRLGSHGSRAFRSFRHVGMVAGFFAVYWAALLVHRAVVGLLVAALAMILGIVTGFVVKLARRKAGNRSWFFGREDFGVLPALAVIIVVSVFFSAAVPAARLSDSRQRTEAWMQLDWFLLEKQFRTAGQYPLPGFFGPADAIPPQLVEHSELFQSRDTWGRSLIYACTPDGKSYLLVSLGARGSLEFGTAFEGQDQKGDDDQKGNIVFSERGGVLYYRGGTLVSAQLDQEFSDERLDGVIETYAWWAEH